MSLATHLRYLIGADFDEGEPGYVTEVGYDAPRLPKHGPAWLYGNLFNEKYSGQGPRERGEWRPSRLRVMRLRPGAPLPVTFRWLQEVITPRYAQQVRSTQGAVAPLPVTFR